MKKLLVTLSLAAAVVSSFAAVSPAKAAPADDIQALPQLVQPNPQDLQLKPAPLIAPSLLLFARAELTSDLHVYWGYHPVFNPHPIPGYPVIVCVVKNWGLKDSGWFKTLLRVQRYDKFHNVQTLQGYFTQSVPRGQYRLIVARVYAPYGLKRVFSYADATSIVPEYIETNNFDSVP